MCVSKRGEVIWMKDFKEFKQLVASGAEPRVLDKNDLLTNLVELGDMSVEEGVLMGFSVAMEAFERELELYHGWLTSQLPSLGDDGGSLDTSGY